MLTATRLREIIKYDEETGAMTWRVSVARRIRPGDACGGVPNSTGALSVRIRGYSYKLHRLAWLYSYGQWPDDHIDHIDGNRLNNRLSNLREATHAENQRNIGLKRNNKSGFKGVYWNKTVEKWHAQINWNGKRIHLGFFEKAKDAGLAHANKAAELHGVFRRVMS